MTLSDTSIIQFNDEEDSTDVEMIVELVRDSNGVIQEVHWRTLDYFYEVGKKTTSIYRHHISPMSSIRYLRLSKSDRDEL